MIAQPAGDHEQAAPGPDTGLRSVMADRLVIGLVACATGGLRTIRDGFVEPALELGWRVAVTLTPTASHWLSDTDEMTRIEQTVEFPVRDRPRLPREPRLHPELACCVVAPASANTVAKLALGISDNQALSTANEAIGDPEVPVIVFPRVSAAHVGHPAWDGHLDSAAIGWCPPRVRRIRLAGRQAATRPARAASASVGRNPRPRLAGHVQVLRACLRRAGVSA